MSKQKAVARFFGKKNEVIKDKYTCPICYNKKFFRKSLDRLKCSKCGSIKKI